MLGFQYFCVQELETLGFRFEKELKFFIFGVQL